MTRRWFVTILVGSVVGGAACASVSEAPKATCDSCEDAAVDAAPKDAQSRDSALDAAPLTDASSPVDANTPTEDADPPIDAAPPPIPCSLSKDATGLTERSILNTAVWSYVPATYDRTKPADLVVALHGSGDTAKHYLTYEWQADADARGLVVIAPQGTKVFSTGFDWQAEDLTRILAAIDDARACYAITEGRTILQGFSSGADMALFVGLRSATELDAIAVASGTLDSASTTFGDGGTLLPAARPIPVSLWHGAGDPVVSADDVTATQTALEAAGHQVFMHSFSGGYTTKPAQALAQYDELIGAFLP